MFVHNTSGNLCIPAAIINSAHLHGKAVKWEQREQQAECSKASTPRWGLQQDEACLGQRLIRSSSRVASPPSLLSAHHSSGDARSRAGGARCPWLAEERGWHHRQILVGRGSDRW